MAAAPRRRPLFLARRAYRRRRLMDAARMLPVAGLGLWLLPLLWSGPGGPGASTRVVHLFGVWALLILAAAALSRRLLRAVDQDEGGPEDGGRDREGIRDTIPPAGRPDPGGPR